MMKMNKNKKGQAGFVITVELLLIVTVLVIGLLAGWAKLRDQVTAELSDAGDAIGSIDNSYKYLGLQWDDGTAGIAAVASFGFDDAPDAASVGSAVGGDGQFIDYKTAVTSSSSTTPVEDGGPLFN